MHLNFYKFIEKYIVKRKISNVLFLYDQYFSNLPLEKNLSPPHNMMPRAEISASSSASTTSRSNSVVRVLAVPFDNLMRT